MPTYKNIRGYLSNWSDVDFAAGINKYYELQKPKNAEWLRLTNAVIEAQGLTHRKMDGTCSQGLKTQEGRSHVSFSKVFHEGINSDFFTPATYVADMVKTSMEAGLSEADTVTEVGRALRALPSFLREMDLGYSVTGLLWTSGCNTALESDPEIDSHEKTDALLHVDGHDYRLWSYMVTDRSLENLRQRLMGKRGKLPAGRHVLCPHQSNYKTANPNELHGWKLYRERDVKAIADLILSGAKPISYAALLHDMDELVTKPTLFEVR